ncbi:MAG: hypothetical protein ABIR71_03935 [Chthoniobacterales bacterium]
MSSYRVAPIFLIRAAGVPFDHLERLATRRTAEAARTLLVRREELSKARSAAEGFIGTRESGLSADDSRAYRSFLRPNAIVPEAHDNLPEPMRIFLNAACQSAVAEAEVAGHLEKEFASARSVLLVSSQSVLPPYLIFSPGKFRDRLTIGADDANSVRALAPRNARAREQDRHLLLYLQRVCAKNDTFSEFGPSAWGTVGGEASRVAFAPVRGVARREVFLERWAAHHLAAALNRDPETRPEVCPRLNPNGRVEGSFFLRLDHDETIPLSPAELDLLARCDGLTPAHALGDAANALENLARLGVILWETEVPAMQARAFDTLAAEIARWRESDTRTTWLSRARSIASLPGRFAATTDLPSRAALMREATDRLAELGERSEGSGRFLYAASNPIAEECVRDCGFEIGEGLTDDLARDAEPWFDLWRDTYAFVASRVAAGLRGLIESAPVQDGAIALPAFLQHCATKNLPLTGPGIVVLAHLAFQEVKAAFREMAGKRLDAEEWELTADDLAFVRRDFAYEKFDAYTYPSADLQLSAASFEAVGRGDYQWVVSELHPPVALLHHALYWSCPDPAALSRALASAACHAPGVHYGFFAADFTSHTTVRYMDALPDLMTFVAPQRSSPGWRTVAPGEVEVFVEEGTGDVALRRRGSREYLGSFARNWVIPLGFHPFHFGREPHMPRLRCGKVIVQRRSWTVQLEELKSGDFTGVSRDLVLAVEQLRAAKGWPRHIYTRPTEQALRRSGAEGRDKDTKPIFIDLESYLSLEIFHRWLVKAGELEITEMRPDPDHLCWQEADGRRTFELRTLIVPRS